MRMRLFGKRDVWVALGGLVLVELLPCLLINRLMFPGARGGYDEGLSGYVDIGTNGARVAARVLGSARDAKAVLYFHGNAEDVTSLDKIRELTFRGCTVAAVDYPGYGLSDGSPTEAGCYANARRLYDWLVEERGFAATNVYVVGYSIGTGVATELATSRPVAGLWLEAAFMSASRAVTRVRVLPVDPFQSASKIGRLRAPLVMLHGTADRIVPYSQGRGLYDLAPQPKRFVTVEGANHVDFVERLGADRYALLLRSFVEGGLPALDAALKD